MADFRKMLYAFALIAVLVGLAMPASAQQMQCTYGAVRPLLRVESFVDFIGDITLDCTGGVSTTAGQTVPSVNIYVYLSATVTSKITSLTPTPLFNEALLIVDEPNRNFNNGVDPTFNNAVLGCGSGNSSYVAGNAGVCDITAPLTTDLTYNGNNVVGAARPNVFQGRQLPAGQPNGVWFSGVPIDPPGANRHRMIRITNIRVNSTTATVGTSLGGNEITANIITDPSTTIPSNIVPLTVGLIQVGYASASGTRAGPWPQCLNTARSGGSIVVTEGFSSAFKPRNWSNFQGNGEYTGTPAAWRLRTLAPNVAVNPLLATNNTDLNQNVPGVVWNTESGFVFDAVNALAIPGPLPGPGTGNPPPGISASPGTDNIASVGFGSALGMNTVGRASHGTRFQFRFANVPIGSGASIPTAIYLTNTTGTTNTGVMVHVPTADAVGAGGVPAVGTGSVAIPDGAGPFNFTFEVMFSDYTALEQATLGVTLNPVVDLGANPPLNGSPQIGVTAQASAGFAPYYPGTSAAANAATLASPAGVIGGFPIPRYTEKFLPTPPVNLWSWTKCACDLLFPWVVGDNTFTTSIVVANTSRDPGTSFGFQPSAASNVANGFGPGTGRVTFWYYGTAGINVSGDPSHVVTAAGFYPAQQTNVLTQPGSYVAHIVSPSAAGTTASNGLASLPGNFAGYVVAQSEFRYCHGIAAISSAIPGFGTQTYLGLVMDNAGLDNTSGFGQLPARTNNLGEQFQH